MSSININVLTDHLNAQMPEAMACLERMVEINSFTGNPPGVNRVGEVTQAFFAELGFEGEVIPSTNPEHGSHLFLHLNAGAKRKVLLVTHLDTVFPPEEEIEQNFHWRVEPAEGRIYGPGSVDIKGGTVLIGMMLRALREFAPEVFHHTEWLMAANAAEEVMSADFAHRVNERCPDGVDAVLVFEGGPRIKDEFHLVTARKGRAEYRISAHGRGAHAGSFHAEGINAIVAVSEVAKIVHALSDYKKELTVNVGRIQGGTVLNRVPHEALVELEMRAFDPAMLERVATTIEMLSMTCPYGATITSQCLGTTPAWPSDARTEPLMAHWKTAAGLLGFKVLATRRGGLSDANYLSHLGPTLDGLGPNGANAHCSERSADGSKVPEYVEVDTFVPKAAMNVLALVELLK